MTNTQTPELSNQPDQPKQPRSKQPKTSRFSWGRAFLTLIFRLLLLGVGGSLTAAVGVAIAQLYPAQTQEPPLLEKLIQSGESLLKNIKQLPQTWDGSASNRAPQTAPAASVPATDTLPETERQQLQAELTQLQAELQTLTSSSTEPLADRVQQIQKRIQTIQARLSAFTTSSPANPTLITPTAASSTIDGNRLMVTLPSDALFAADQTTLRPQTAAILDSIVTDLQRYPGAAIQVAAHSDSQGGTQTDRQRSLEQAKAVQQYLSTKLDNVHWVTVGYGHNRPLVPENSPENQQRNRRIEIVIDPG